MVDLEGKIDHHNEKSHIYHKYNEVIQFLLKSRELDKFSRMVLTFIRFYLFKQVHFPWVEAVMVYRAISYAYSAALGDHGVVVMIISHHMQVTQRYNFPTNNLNL